MALNLVFAIILIFLVVGLLPHWPYSTGWGLGYYPSGVLGFVLLVLIILMIFGR